MEEYSHKKFAVETVKKICWVKKMFLDWKENRNRFLDVVPITADLENPIESGLTKAQLSYALVRFVSEIKKLDGTDYPPKTIYELVISIQMYLKTKGLFWKLLDEKEPVFQRLHCTVDNVMKECAATGIRSLVKHAQVILYSDEELMWSSGVLGTSNPEQLVDTLLFLLGMHCAGNEHRNLQSLGKNSQFKYRMINGVCHLVYNEDLGTKMNRGGLKHKQNPAKEVIIFPQTN